MEKQSNAGGKRIGSGRKKLDTSKKPITLYLCEKKIGPKENRKDFILKCYEILERYL